MAMLIESLNIENYAIILTNCYVRVDSIYWHRTQPTKLVVLVNIWPNIEASNTSIPFTKNYTLDITSHTGLFTQLRAAVYVELEANYPEFNNAIEV